MTATERLRSLLDERGVEWDCVDTYNGNKRTMWGSVERGAGILGLDVKYSAIEFQKGLRLTISDCSPEQAIEATLGRGECELLGYDDGVDEAVDGEWVQYAPPRWFLSCGHEVEGSEKPNYCPSCGKKVRA